LGEGSCEPEQVGRTVAGLEREQPPALLSCSASFKRPASGHSMASYPKGQSASVRQAFSRGRGPLPSTRRTANTEPKCTRRARRALARRPRRTSEASTLPDDTAVFEVGSPAHEPGDERGLYRCGPLRKGQSTLARHRARSRRADALGRVLVSARVAAAGPRRSSGPAARRRRAAGQSLLGRCQIVVHTIRPTTPFVPSVEAVRRAPPRRRGPSRSRGTPGSIRSSIRGEAERQLRHGERQATTVPPRPRRCRAVGWGGERGSCQRW